MNNPAFLIDGFTEKLIIQNICPNKPIRRIDLNGKNVTLEAMAKRICSLIRLLGDKNYPIIIVVDKEERNISPKQMAEQLLILINNEEIKTKQICIGVADRMLENWIIADWDILQTKEVKPQNTDGINGVSIIKKIKKTYDKTTDGVDMFLNTDFSKVYTHSASFREFIDKLINVDCFYINKKLKNIFDLKDH